MARRVTERLVVFRIEDVAAVCECQDCKNDAIDELDAFLEGSRPGDYFRLGRLKEQKVEFVGARRRNSWDREPEWERLEE